MQPWFAPSAYQFDQEERERLTEQVPTTSSAGLRVQLHEDLPSDRNPVLDTLSALVGDGSISEGCEQAQEFQALGDLAYERFMRSGDIGDVNKAIEYLEIAATLMPSSQMDRACILSNLVWALMSRFQRLGDNSDLGGAIRHGEEAIGLTGNDHPNKPRYLNNLGAAYKARFGRLGDLSALNKAIDLQAEAVSLAPDGHPERPGYLNSLGNSYEARFRYLGELSDMSKAIEYKTTAVSLTPDGDPYKPRHLTNLGISFETRFWRLGELSDLNYAIKYKAEAVSLTPDGHSDKPGLLNNLGNSYKTRFERLGELYDLNKAIEFHGAAVSLIPDDHPQKPAALNNLGSSNQARFEYLGERSDLNNAIELLAMAVSLAPDGHLDEPKYLNNLGISYENRFKLSDELSDLGKSIECKMRAVSLTPDGHPNKPTYLINLGISYEIQFERVGKLSDLDNAIELQLRAVSLTPDTHPDKPGHLNSLGNSYKTRFERLNQLSDLNEAIDTRAKAVSLTPNGHPSKTGYLYNLGVSHKSRFERLNQLSELQSAVLAFRRAAQSPTGPSSIRFRACRQWARLCPLAADTGASQQLAYQHAMEMLPQFVWIGTTINRRYELAKEASGFATEAASHAISIGAYGLALEWLEAGRSIIWGQLAQLRTPFEHLSHHNSDLAEELTSVGRRLERAGSRPSTASLHESGNRDLGQEANTHVQLALQWEALLKDVRSMPGFEDFLCAPKASHLLAAAKVYPVAVINLHESRCDALIIQPNIRVVSHVPLTGFSAGNAISVRHHVFSSVRERKLGPPLKPVGGALDKSLDELWTGVVKPVLEFLGYRHVLPIDERPHLTWCTTGLISFLPLHATRSHDPSQPSTFDLVISSYTPTIGALLASQSVNPDTNCGILAVGQEHTPGLASLPYTTTELAVIQKHLKSDYYLQLEGKEATVEQVMDAMDQFSWVHLACHGSQDADDPTQSAFHLHDGNLTLGAITRRSFTNKGLAFLSACQTATGDKNIPDEAVHLAAGMLVAGYPSVIGTMWSIADEDGPGIADRVYARLLKDGTMNYTRAARALHQAVEDLRAKVGEKAVARWAPFVHIGS